MSPDAIATLTTFSSSDDIACIPQALEAALKLKEISYLNATGYPAGEMKHGPIALVDPNLPVIGLCGNHRTLDKMLSNLTEVKSRGAPLLGVCL